ncbi:kinesin-like protein KIN-7O [Coccinella septempunctata]|uniref:kinesin-like protein KIN-7O n=1 Tax=Coccinella septempunctata TaxID=41139 RepID=UPI001D068564|nr:kinesin-like protein KIN-7O [Coccinella septempunctata]
MSSDNIKVVVRARPFKKTNTDFVPWIIDEKTIFQSDEDKIPIGDKYSYDEVFNVNSKNIDVYNTSISPLVCSAVEGINLTIFAYGATSSGKTYTMNGISEDPGIIPRFIEDIFDKVESYTNRKFLIRVSYVEIYSEIINDLLDKNNKDLKIREDINNFVSYNPKEQIVKSSAECLNVMKLGTCNRTVGETNMNLFSSRSHSIFRIVIESAPTASSENDPVQVSHVNLIDLAGSERVSQTGATGQRFKEGAHINKSLTTLGLVIKQLVEKKEYVNYRDSKLTRILSNSLGGNAKTLIICNINLESIEDTASTLMFAQRAKAIKNKPKVNEIMNEAALTKKYAKECDEIKKLLDVEFEKNKQLEDEREMSNKKIEELRSRIKSLQEIFVKKETVSKPPKRRHTFCTLGAISEDRELENASKNLISVGLTSDVNASTSSGSDSNVTFRRNSWFNSSENGTSVDSTPPKNLRARLEILTREHEELIEYTRLEKSVNQAMETKLKELENESQDLKMLAEVKDQQLKSEYEKAVQMKIDFEFLLETQRKNFQRREIELLEQLKQCSNKVVPDTPVSNENIPLAKITSMNSFDYEEVSEKMESLNRQNEEMSGLIADLRSSISTLELQNSQLKIKNKSLQTKVLDMELKVNNSKHAAESSSNDVDSSKRKIVELEGKIEELKAERGRIMDELYESQDKLVEITEDLDIEEKKSSSLEKQLSKEKEIREELESKLLAEVTLRQEAESRITKEVELRQDAELRLTKEVELRQEVESELKKEVDLRQEAELKLKKEPELRQEAELKLKKELELRQEAELKLKKEVELRQEAESKLKKEVELRKEAELKLTKELELRQGDVSKLEKERESRQEAVSELDNKQKSRRESHSRKDDLASKLAREIELRQEIELELFREKELVKQAERKLAKEAELSLEVMQKLRALQNILEPKSQSDELPNKITTGYRKESIPENQPTANGSYLDMSDLDQSLNQTSDSLYVSTQEIDQDNLEQFSSSYFQDTSKSNNFMNFFNSLVSNDDDISQLRDNTASIGEGKENKNEYGMNEIEKLQKDLNSVKLQRETDIITIKKLQAKLEEFRFMNLCDTEKINKNNEILGALNSLEAEKAENLSLIQKLKEQCQNDKVDYQEIQNYSKKLERIIEQLNTENANLKRKIDTQKSEIDKNLEILANKEEALRNLEAERKMVQENLDVETSKLKQEQETNRDILVERDLLRIQIEEMTMSIQRKDEVNAEKMEVNKELQQEKNSLQQEINTQSARLQRCHNDLNDIEINLQICSDKIEINEEKNKEYKSLSNQDKERLVVLLNETDQQKEKIKELSITIQDKEKIITSLTMDIENLGKQKSLLSDEINDLTTQVQSQTKYIEQRSETIKNNEFIISEMTKQNEILKKEQENTHSALTEEREKNMTFSNEIQILKNETRDLSSSLEAKEQIIASVNTQKMNLEKERDDLYLKIKDLSERIEDQKNNETIFSENKEKITNLTNSVNTLRAEIDQMTISMQDKDEIIASILSEKTDLEKEKNDLCQRIKDLGVQLENKTELLEEQRKALNNKDQTLRNMAEDMEVLQKDQQLMSSSLKEEKEKNKRCLNDLEDLKVESKSLLLSLQEKDKIIKKSNAEKIFLEEDRNNLSIRINDLLAHIERQKTNEGLRDDDKRKVANLMNDVTELKNTIENLKISIRDKEQVIAKMCSEKIVLEKEKTDLTNTINNLKVQEQTHCKLQEEHNESIRKKEHILQNIRRLEDLETLKKEQEITQINLKQEKEKNIHLLNEIEHLQIECKNLSLSLEEKDSIIAKMNTDKIHSEEERSKLSSQIDNLMIQIKKKQETIDKVNELLEEKDFSLLKVSKEYEILKEKNEKNILSLKSQELRNQNLSKSVEELKEENGKLVVSVQKLEKNIADMIIEKNRLENEKSNLTALFESQKMESETYAQKLSKERDAILSKLETERAEYDKERGKLLTQLNVLRDETVKHVIRIQELNEVINNNNSRMEQLEIDNKELKHDLEEKNSLLVKEKEEVVRLKKTEEEMKKSNSDMLDYVFRISNDKEEIESKMQYMRIEIAEQLGEYIQNMERLLGIDGKKNWKTLAQRQKLETRLEEVKTIENLVTAFVKERSDNTDYKKKLEDAERYNKELISSMQMQQEQTNFLQSTLEKSRKEHEKAISDYEDKLQMMSKKLKTISVEHIEDKKKIENLEYELRMSKRLKSTGNSQHNTSSEKNICCELKNSEDKWKQQRTRAHDSRRSIDLNTLCSESTVDTCNYCENMNKSAQKMKMELERLKEEMKTLKDKYEKIKMLCRLRNEEIQELKRK